MRVGNLVAGIILSCIGIILIGVGVFQLNAYNTEMSICQLSAGCISGFTYADPSVYEVMITFGVVFFLIPGIINVLVGAIMKPKPIIPKPQIPVQQQQQQQQQVVIIPQQAPVYAPAPVPTPAPVQSSTPTAETKFCSSCGQPIKKMAKFCDSCGAEQ